MPCRRATALGEPPGSKLSMTMSRFCSGVQIRRRSPRVITSIGASRTLIRLVVGVSSTSAARGRSVLSIPPLHHSDAPRRNVPSPRRLRTEQTLKRSISGIAADQPTSVVALSHKAPQALSAHRSRRQLQSPLRTHYPIFAPTLERGSLTSLSLPHIVESREAGEDSAHAPMESERLEKLAQWYVGHVDLRLLLQHRACRLLRRQIRRAQPLRS